MRPKASLSMRGRDLGDLFEEVLEEGTGEEIVGLGRTPARCGLCFSMSRIAAFTLAPMFSDSGNVRR